MIKAHAVPVPTDSVLAPLYVGADLLDAYAIPLPVGATDDLEVLARAGFERQAWWIRALTRVRDMVMATVGVKSSRAVGVAAAARGPVIGFFPLLSKSARELVMGKDDRHLDFRLAILLRPGAAGGRERRLDASAMAFPERPRPSFFRSTKLMNPAEPSAEYCAEGFVMTSMRSMSPPCNVRRYCFASPEYGFPSMNILELLEPSSRI